MSVGGLLASLGCPRISQRTDAHQILRARVVGRDPPPPSQPKAGCEHSPSGRGPEVLLDYRRLGLIVRLTGGLSFVEPFGTDAEFPIRGIATGRSG